jgi:hypothetical protein
MATGKKITKYTLSWNHKTNKGDPVEVLFEDGTTEKLEVNNANEFLILAAVLNQSPVYMRDDGMIKGVDKIQDI